MKPRNCFCASAEMKTFVNRPVLNRSTNQPMKNQLVCLIVVSSLASRLLGLAQQAPISAAQPLPPQPVIQVTPAVTAPATQVTSYTEAANAATNLPAAELVPLIVIEDSPLLDAIKNLARLANINIHFDPRVLVST